MAMEAAQERQKFWSSPQQATAVTFLACWLAFSCGFNFAAADKTASLAHNVSPQQASKVSHSQHRQHLFGLDEDDDLPFVPLNDSRYMFNPSEGYIITRLQALMANSTGTRLSSTISQSERSSYRRQLPEKQAHHHRWTSDFMKFLEEEHHPPLEGTPGGIGPIRTQTLGMTIDRGDLIPVIIDYYKNVQNPSKEKKLDCKGGDCPDFKSCGSKSVLETAQACWNEALSDPEYEDLGPPLNCPLLQPLKAPGVIPEFDPECSHEIDYIRYEKHVAQVYVLHDVYINSHGHVFTKDYHINRGGCAMDSKYVFPPKTPVKVFKEMVNLAHWNAYAFFHGLVELMPTFLLLADIMSAMPGVPVAHRNGQHSFLETVGLPLLGIRADQINIHEIHDGKLFFAEKVYQPYYAPCARPSRAQWSFLRQNFLLPPDGIPMLNPDWTLRLPEKVASESDRHPQDWTVVFAKRYGERGLKQTDEVEAVLKRLFTPQRVKIFDGSLHILEAKELFNKARLYVAGHGAALTNMFFMPFNSYVFEIRPRDYPNSCFHHLAGVSHHKYYLVMGEGNKHTQIDANTTEITQVLEDIAAEILGR